MRNFSKFERSSIVVYIEAQFDLNEINDWLFQYQDLNSLRIRPLQQKYYRDLRSKINVLNEAGQEDALMYLRNGNTIDWNEVTLMKNSGLMRKYN